MASSDISGVVTGADGKPRCFWAASTPLYELYHDTEWGRPVSDDIRLFEKMCLEGFQSGLSWLTILNKRENFRAAFAGFDFNTVAQFDETDVERLLQDAGIVRHRGKITSTINNARQMAELISEHGSFARYCWSFEPPVSERPTQFDKSTLMQLAKTPTSTAFAKDLKKRGFSFFGPTTAYAFMQAMGLVNDHMEGCWCRSDCENERATFVRP